MKQQTTTNNIHITQTYASTHPKVQKDPTIAEIVKKWEKQTPSGQPVKWPLPIQQWAERLRNYPDQQYAQQFLRNLENGFPTTSDPNMKTEMN